MLALSNLSKPSNKKWKKIADILLYTLPLYATAFAVGADELWSAKTALILTLVINLTVVTIKAISKFTAEEDVVK